jgi:hypothetical protein
MPLKFRSFSREPQRLVLTPSQQAGASRRVMNENVRGMADFPEDVDRAKRLVEGAAAEHVSDGREYLYPLIPRGLARDAVRDRGSSGAAVTSNRALWNALNEDPTYTRKLNNTHTGNDPTLIADNDVHTAHSAADPHGYNNDVPAGGRAADRHAHESPMGMGSNVAVTKTTPWRLLDRMTGDKDRSTEILTRINERNAPGGAEGAAVFHLDNLQRAYNTPWLVFRSLNDSFGDGGVGRAGFADAVAKQIYLNRSGDPYAVRNRDGEFNVGQHEFIHSLLDPVAQPRSFIAASSSEFPIARPVVRDRKFDVDGQADYLAKDAAELSNLLFHLKRQTEVTDPDWADIAPNLERANEWLESVRRWRPTGSDPIIRKPGHIHEGQPAHGYEQGMEWLQQIQEALGEQGLEDLQRLNFKTGQTPSLREALLA